MKVIDYYFFAALRKVAEFKSNQPGDGLEFFMGEFGIKILIEIHQAVLDRAHYNVEIHCDEYL